MKKLLVLVLALWPLTAFAQHGMMVTVQADRILIGTPDYVPRCLDQPKVLHVISGSISTAPADATFDCIEVAGTLRISRTTDTILRFTHFFIHPGGVLDVGTVADPIPADRRVTFIVRDVPIDTTRDPFQWGNGLLNFGRQTRVGAAKTTWTALTAGVAGGVTTITLATDPVGWRVGDELLLPDTARTVFPALPRREAPLTVKAIMGRTVTLSKPLDFSHPAIQTADGTFVLQPRVANLTRNITIRSENPAGTPGHTANVGMDASWDVRYNAFIGLGRTKNIVLDSYVAATGHIGTNQVGRYADHQHHAKGFGSSSIGNSYQGGVGKWGLAIHGTHDGLFEWNVAAGFTGSGFVTEDGYETRNVFRRNFSAYNFGNHTGNANIEDANALGNLPGSAGNGFWFRGIQNTFDGNEAWSNHIGFNLFNFRSVAGSYPSVPGGDLDTPFNVFVATPILHTGTVAAADTVDNIEYWGVPDFPASDPISANPGSFGLFAGLSGNASVSLVNPTFIGGGAPIGIHAQVAYTVTLRLDGGRIEGFTTGQLEGGHYNFIKGTKFANNGLDMDWTNFGDTLLMENVPGKPTMKFGTAVVWSGTGPLPDTGVSRFTNQRGSQFKIKNWNGTGQDFRLFTQQQLASTAAWPAAYHYPDFWGSPELGLTMGQSWAKDGIAFLGEAVTTPVPLEGLLMGLAAPGLNATLGPPQAIVTLPNAHEAAPVANGGIDAYLLVTGDPTQASETVLISVDGDDPFPSLPPETGGRDARTVRLTAHLTDGPHIMETWRTTAGGAAIPASKRVFAYTVGNGPPPPDICPNLAGAQPTVPPGRVLTNGQCVCAPGTVEGMNGQCVVPTPTPVWHPTLTPGVEQFGTENRFRICNPAMTCFEFQMK